MMMELSFSSHILLLYLIFALLCGAAPVQPEEGLKHESYSTSSSLTPESEDLLRFRIITSRTQWTKFVRTVFINRASTRHVLALYTMGIWSWCDHCRKLENVTTQVRSLLRHQDIVSNSDHLLTAVVVDCSSMSIEAPCKNVLNFPALLLHEQFDNFRTGEVRRIYSGPAEVSGILHFLNHQLPSIVTTEFLLSKASRDNRERPSSSNRQQCSQQPTSEVLPA